MTKVYSLTESRVESTTREVYSLTNTPPDMPQPSFSYIHGVSSSSVMLTKNRQWKVTLVYTTQIKTYSVDAIGDLEVSDRGYYQLSDYDPLRMI
jgi:hypothetical protein